MAEETKQVGESDNVEKTQPRRRQRRREERVPFSNPEIEHKILFKTQDAMRLFTRNFMTASQALFNIMINTTRLERLGQRGAAASAKKAIDSAMDIPTKEIDVAIDAMNAMLSEAGDVAEVKYTNPREFETSTRTPEAARLIRLFSRYDLIVTLLDKTYLNGLAPADEVEDTKSRLSRSIQELIKTIKTHAQSSVDRLEKLAGAENTEANDEKKEVEHLVQSEKQLNPENAEV